MSSNKLTGILGRVARVGAVVGGLMLARLAFSRPRPRPGQVPEHKDLDVLLQEAGVRDFTAADLACLSSAKKAASIGLPECPAVPSELVPNIVKMGAVLQALQDVLTPQGIQIEVVNGWRPKPYNKLVKGAPDSAHIRGAAVDLIVAEGSRKKGTGRRLQVEAAKMWVNDDRVAGLGVYKNANNRGRVHLDVWHPGGRKNPAKWGSGDVEGVVAAAKKES